LYLKKELKNNSNFNNNICACFEALNFVYQSILEMKKVSEKEGEKIEDKLNQVILSLKNEKVLKALTKIICNEEMRSCRRIAWLDGTY